MKNAYLVLDIGTGNVRVALADEYGKVISMERDTMHYVKDDLYADALSFSPDILWTQIGTLTKKLLSGNPDYKVVAVTSGSQREGIVLIDAHGRPLTGLPNHDHRGREWEHEIDNKGAIYHKTGRYPSSLFSAMKVLAIRRRQPELAARLACMMSISDWAGYKLTGVTAYEHSQASETLLYDIEKKTWSDELCAAFTITPGLLPPLKDSGTVLGNILPEYLDAWGLGAVPFVVGGADTQLAVQSTQPEQGDIVIVSGTTTPVVKIIDNYITDKEQRTWTNRHTDPGYFILETNAGVTGLNLQRLMKTFYPNEGYAVMEQELSATPETGCVASLGSMIAGEAPITRGGFVFEVPVGHDLSRADFVRAVLSDMAACVRANLDILISISGYDRDYVWACGGGFQSDILVQHLSDLVGKTIRRRGDFQHASVVGSAFVCNTALGIKSPGQVNYQSTIPSGCGGKDAYATQWRTVRDHFAEKGKNS